MLSLVIDCSITMAWHFPDEKTLETEAVLDRLDRETAIVPSHWILEVTNVLNYGIKRGRTTEVTAADFLDQLQKLNLSVATPPAIPEMPALLSLARQHQLTVYDAAYLALTKHHNLELASLDDDLRAAATSIGLKVTGK